MTDGTGLAEALLGLDGFRVLDVVEIDAEVIVTVETTADVVGCWRCGVRAEAKGRMTIDIRDLACFGRPARCGGSSAGGAASIPTARPARGPSARLTSTRRPC